MPPQQHATHVSLRGVGENAAYGYVLAVKRAAFSMRDCKRPRRRAQMRSMRGSTKQQTRVGTRVQARADR